MASPLARAARAARRERLAVDAGAAVNLVGSVVKYLGAAFLLPAAVALWYGESATPFLASGVLAAAAGSALERTTRGKEHVTAREGFLVVALTWLLAAVVGSLPFLFSGDDQFSRPLDALFESMSGFTTTGSSVATDIDGMTRSLAMWRQLTQWLGGMGIIVLALAILPRLRVGGRQLFESEVPGPEVETLSASIRETARRLWALYIFLTVVLVAVLTAYAATGVDDRMSFYDAVAHAFTTMPTGGFSPEARSLAAFGPATQWTVALFMTLAGANFAVMYVAFFRGRAGALARDEELRIYVGVLVLASLVLAVELGSEGIANGEAAARHAVFQVVSLTTTTGYATADFAVWPSLAAMLLVGLMFIGGSAGSTSGSIKVIRHVLIGRILRRELDQTVHPELVSPIRLNRGVVDERTVRAVIGFVLLYVGIFVVGALLIGVAEAIAGRQLTPFQAVAAAATTLGNVGPAFGFAGPFGSFEPFSDASALVMIVLMWLGRLEIVPIAVLLTRAYWRR